jgi:hypothetical protein
MGVDYLRLWNVVGGPPKELAKWVGLHLPLECLGAYHTATVPPKQSNHFTEEDDAKGKDMRLRMMEGGRISDQLSTDFISGVRPPNMTFQVTILLLVFLQLRKCAEYVAIFVLVLDPQLDGLEVQAPPAIMLVDSELPINGDVWFLLLF